ncbi:maleylpyruvate isomerase family mycothiol-dependent enzyme [Jatrophihabitans sp.]|uniref:maleylpyruvate isomerase family mycothiol-dependent enzyme n=1 Tax=Jatrophihabitans sp. TaxID=1932789 RepID=UPI002BB32EF6|nr:maleylpyruvate isomerase family mycothiol-dependent enzyme [Jatrophihabitans sp.]
MTADHAELLHQLGRSHARLAETLAGLTDSQARQPSRLPGWSRGHVATHLCRNADAIRRLALGVLSREPAEMYPGGPDARNAAIEEGAGRPASLLAADHDFAGSRALATLRLLPEDALDTPVRWRKPVAARDLVTLRWREVEIHHLDLDLGHTPADWPAEFVAATLTTELPALKEAVGDVAVPELPDHEVLAWLVGRPTRPDLPEIPSWPF